MLSVWEFENCKASNSETTIMRADNTFKLIQCYHCLALSDHTKPYCPAKEDPQICGRCGAAGHPSKDCSAPTKCYLWGEAGYPATARICPVYLQTFKTKIQEPH